MNWDEYNKQKKAEAAKRRKAAAQDYSLAKEIASNGGLVLKQCSDTQYQLFPSLTFRPSPYWLLNIYPGNCRLYWDKKHKGKYLKIDSPWTLLDVVEAAIKT